MTMSSIWESGAFGFFLIGAKFLIILVIGFFLAKFLSRRVERYLTAKLSTQLVMLARKLVYFVVLLVFILTALQQLHLKLNAITSAILGAGGILTLAVGFASKTSASNLISGLFLVFEKSFEVGDTITVNNFTGKVESIDSLSVKLTTVDNTMVRIPNETMINSHIQNLSYFNKRRLDLVIGVDYQEDVRSVIKKMESIAKEHPLSLSEPAPQAILLKFAESSVNLHLSTWVSTDNYGSLKNELQVAIKEAFDKAKINIPYPQRTLHLASQENPILIKQ